MTDTKCVFRSFRRPSPSHAHAQHQHFFHRDEWSGELGLLVWLLRAAEQPASSLSSAAIIVLCGKSPCCNQWPDLGLSASSTPDDSTPDWPNWTPVCGGRLAWIVFPPVAHRPRCISIHTLVQQKKKAVSYCFFKILQKRKKDWTLIASVIKFYLC